MTLFQQILTIVICALGTMTTRFLPFLVFSQNRETPKYVRYLGKALPGAIFGMLIVYCLRNVSLVMYSYGIPELIGIAVTAGLHIWKRKTLLSIAAGTAVYMLLIQFVF